MTKELNELREENNTLKDKIEKAKNCLVCACIADPGEVCKNTLMILENDD